MRADVQKIVQFCLEVEKIKKSKIKIFLVWIFFKIGPYFLIFFPQVFTRANSNLALKWTEPNVQTDLFGSKKTAKLVKILAHFTVGQGLT